MQNIGTCHWCNLPIPAHTIDGTKCREGIEFKQVLGEPETMWHFQHPLFPDCFHAEAEDPNSVWYDDSRRYSQDFEGEALRHDFSGAFFEELE